MPLFYCCPCLNVRVSCRSVSNNLPPFATEMAVARRAFEQGGGHAAKGATSSAATAPAHHSNKKRTTPSAIAKLSVAGVSTEHAKLVRSTSVRSAPRWDIVHCLLCNTRVASTCSGATAIVNSALALTEVDLEKRQKDPRYCGAFKVLVVQPRSGSKKKKKRRSARAAAAAAGAGAGGGSTADAFATALNSEALALVGADMIVKLNALAKDYVATKELEAQRRVEVYYNEEQAKLRAMHRRLKSQMDSLTTQMAKVLTSEDQFQKDETARLRSSSGDEGGASASATSMTSSPGKQRRRVS